MSLIRKAAIGGGGLYLILNHAFGTCDGHTFEMFLIGACLVACRFEFDSLADR